MNLERPNSGKKTAVELTRNDNSAQAHSLGLPPVQFFPVFVFEGEMRVSGVESIGSDNGAGAVGKSIPIAPIVRKAARIEHCRKSLQLFVFKAWRRTLREPPPHKDLGEGRRDFDFLAGGDHQIASRRPNLVVEKNLEGDRVCHGLRPAPRAAVNAGKRHAALPVEAGTLAAQVNHVAKSHIDFDLDGGGLRFGRGGLRRGCRFRWGCGLHRCGCGSSSNRGRSRGGSNGGSFRSSRSMGGSRGGFGSRSGNGCGTRDSFRSACNSFRGGGGYLCIGRFQGGRGRAFFRFHIQSSNQLKEGRELAAPCLGYGSSFRVFHRRHEDDSHVGYSGLLQCKSSSGRYQEIAGAQDKILHERREPQPAHVLQKIFRRVRKLTVKAMSSITITPFQKPRHGVVARASIR